MEKGTSESFQSYKIDTTWSICFQVHYLRILSNFWFVTTYNGRATNKKQDKREWQNESIKSFYPIRIHIQPYIYLMSFLSCISRATEVFTAVCKVPVLPNGHSQGLRTPNEAFFHWNPKLLDLGRQIGQINSGAFGVFSAELATFILITCTCFPLFFQKTKVWPTTRTTTTRTINLC